MKEVNSKKRPCEVTDLVSTGVEEVPQTDDVAVVQLSHDLQLTVLQNTKEKERPLIQCVDGTTEEDSKVFIGLCTFTLEQL